MNAAEQLAINVDNQTPLLTIAAQYARNDSLALIRCYDCGVYKYTKSSNGNINPGYYLKTAQGFALCASCYITRYPDVVARGILTVLKSVARELLQ